MSEKLPAGKEKSGSRIASVILFVLAGILLILALTGFILRGTDQSRSNLSKMRTQAILHSASEGLIEKIAQEARADKLSELRKDKDFRKRGLNEVNEICDAAMAEARAEAEQKYSSPKVADETALKSAIDGLEDVLSITDSKTDAEKASYSDLYIQLTESVVGWRQIAPDGADDAAVSSELIRLVPDLDKEENRHHQSSFIAFARAMAAKEQLQEDEKTAGHAISLMVGGISDWSEYNGLDNDQIWKKLLEEIPDLANYEAFRDRLTGGAKQCIQAAVNGEALPELVAQEDEGAVIASEALVDYSYFTPSDELETALAKKSASYEILYAELIRIIPDLDGMSAKLKDTLRTNIENVVRQGNMDFATTYNAYVNHGGEAALQSGHFAMKLASYSKTLLLGCIAILLLGLMLFFWKKLTSSFGVPRTIITLFFIYLCLLAEIFQISVRMMLGNVLERMTMYGVLVLAMMPGIQCGIGLNMGMTIGCIAGLLGIVLALQFNMIGFGALLFACLCGMVIALPLGWSYSKLLNRMKGNEMTISTYVGFSFVSLMCIGWMLLPFNNPKIIWLLSGRGLRVTHSLLGSFAHLLDNALSFRLFGVKIPTGGLLFLGACCLLMWLFSRSRTGIAMTAAGSNPRFAEASGISVDRMRTIGTILSTVIAAVGIVIYSQAFGYAQLYTAPRQLGFIASSAILIGGATVSKAKVSHVLIGVFLFEGVLVFGQQIANSAVSGGGLSEVMRIMISNGIILYALTQSGGGKRD